MDRDEVWQTIDRERLGIADLLDDLRPAEWETPSLCTGWRVRDVAAHLTLAHTGAARAAWSLLRAGGSFDRMVRDTAIRQARLPVDRFAALLRAMAGSRRKAPVVSDLEPLLDALVHGQDMAIPLGRHLPMPERAAATVATRAWAMGWPFHAARRLRGFRLTATDCDWTAGDGERVDGPIAALLLLSTGRNTALRELTGPGAVELGVRLSTNVA